MKEKLHGFIVKWIKLENRETYKIDSDENVKTSLHSNNTIRIITHGDHTISVRRRISQIPDAIMFFLMGEVKLRFSERDQLVKLIESPSVVASCVSFSTLVIFMSASVYILTIDVIAGTIASIISIIIYLISITYVRAFNDLLKKRVLEIIR